MSGVVDEKGQQWEHCNCCGKFVRFPQDLGYEEPSDEHKYGRDLCTKCTNEAPDIERIRPAPSWVPQYETTP
mgnify:CR=1 FL=1